MRLHTLWVLHGVLVIAGACGRQAASPPAPLATQATAAARAPGPPDTIAGFRHTSTGPVRGAPQDTAHRFATSDTSIHVTAFRYAIPEYARVAPDSQAWTVREGSGFPSVFSIMKSRGTVQDFEVASTKTSVLRVAGRDVAEHMTTSAARARGKSFVDEQFIYIVRGKFLKVRATMPADRYPAMSAQTFARALAHYMETGQRP